MGRLSTTECTYLSTSFSTLLTIIPCYTRHVYTSKVFDAF